ncbi:MAG: hypothetical protein AB8B83_09125, partial [Bdellovibrionales bacterium]
MADETQNNRINWIDGIIGMLAMYSPSASSFFSFFFGNDDTAAPDTSVEITDPAAAEREITPEAPATDAAAEIPVENAVMVETPTGATLEAADIDLAVSAPTTGEAVDAGVAAAGEEPDLVSWDPSPSAALGRDWSGLSELGLDPNIFETLQEERREEFLGTFAGADELGLDVAIFDEIPSSGIADEDMMQSDAWLNGAEVLYQELNPGSPLPNATELAAWAEEQVSLFDNSVRDIETSDEFPTDGSRTAIQYLSALNERTVTEWSDRGRAVVNTGIGRLWDRVRDPSEGIADEDAYDRSTAFGAQYLEAAEILYNEEHGEGAWEAHIEDRRAEAMANAEGWNFNDFNPFAQTDRDYAANFNPDRELAEWAQSEAVWFQNNIVSQWSRNGTAFNEGLSDRARMALNLIVDMNDLTESDWTDFSQVMGASLSDPTQIAAGVAIGVGTAAAVATLPVSGTAALLVGGATIIGTGAVEGALSEHMLNTGVQELRIQAGTQETFDYDERSQSRLQGAVGGALMAPAFAGAGYVGGRIVRSTGLLAPGATATPTPRNTQDPVNAGLVTRVGQRLRDWEARLPIGVRMAQHDPSVLNTRIPIDITWRGFGDDAFANLSRSAADTLDRMSTYLRGPADGTPRPPRTTPTTEPTTGTRPTPADPVTVATDGTTTPGGDAPDVTTPAGDGDATLEGGAGTDVPRAPEAEAGTGATDPAATAADGDGPATEGTATPDGEGVADPATTTTDGAPTADGNAAAAGPTQPLSN